MTTTIKVSDELRDRLKAQASRSGLTLGAHLATLADAEDRRRRLAALKSAIKDSPSDVDISHAAESDLWEATELTDASRG
jgi:predicted transcriptional regulator